MFNDSLVTIIEWAIYTCDSNCSVRVDIDKSLVTTSSEILIPAKTLAYGTYQLKLTVAMRVSPKLIASAEAYVRIIPIWYNSEPCSIWNFNDYT